MGLYSLQLIQLWINNFFFFLGGGKIFFAFKKKKKKPFKLNLLQFGYVEHEVIHKPFTAIVSIRLHLFFTIQCGLKRTRCKW